MQNEKQAASTGCALQNVTNPASRRSVAADAHRTRAKVQQIAHHDEEVTKADSNLPQRQHLQCRLATAMSEMAKINKQSKVHAQDLGRIKSSIANLLAKLAACGRQAESKRQLMEQLQSKASVRTAFKRA